MKELIARPAQASDLPTLAALLGRPVALPTAPEQLLVVAPGQAGATPDSAVLATARLAPAIGLQQPRLWYHVGCVVHAAPELGINHRQRTLLLGHDHTGASELCDIAWLAPATAAATSPSAGADLPLPVQASVLRLLLHSAWLYLARERSVFADRLIVELPGLRDSAGQSPFWQGLGRHFYSGDPAAAHARFGPAWRSLVAALLPRQQVHASFLPATAQAAIGQVHEQALLLRDVLQDAGLRYGHHVNLEDAGPVLEADTDALPGLASARRWTCLLYTSDAADDM
jgi:arginine N-succinyltransferase